MVLRLESYSLKELDTIYDRLCDATLVCREIGDYALAAMLLATRRRVLDRLNAVMAESETYKARQLSLTPPGAYERP